MKLLIDDQLVGSLNVVNIIIYCTYVDILRLKVFQNVFVFCAIII